MSGLFDGIDPTAPEATAEASSRLYVTLKQLPEPRSLAEAGPTDDDYRWLTAWLGNVDLARLNWWMASTGPAGVNHPLTRKEATGLLLLLFTAETARRDAGEHTMWPYVFTATPARVRGELFIQKQPNPLYKRAVEAAGRRCRLRHVFGEEGTQAWYTSTFLQFGPSRRGLKNVALWLVGQATPEAVERLRDTGHQHSSSFKRLWDRLRQYRSRNVSEASMRTELLESPWVLDAWVDEVLQQAGPARPAPGDDGEAAVDFLAPPTLEWPVFGDPVFRSAVQRLAEIGLEPGEYQLKAGNESIRFIVNELGDPIGEPESLVFQATATKPSVSASIHAVHTSDVVATQELMLWPSTEDVAIYRVGGRRLDPYGPIATGVDYGLIAAQDLKVEPFSLARQPLARKFNLYRVPAVALDATRVLLEGALIWRPGEAQSGTMSPLRDVRVEPAAVDGRPRVGGKMRLRLRAIPGTLVGLRVGAEPAQWTVEEGLTYSEAFDASLERVLSPLSVRVVAEVSGELHARRVTVALPVSGAAVEDVDGWRVIRETESVEDLVGRRVRLLWPPGMEPNAGQYALLESGIHHIGPAWSGTRTMGELAGLGGPLGAYDSAFNLPVTARPRLSITDVVQDTGVLLAGFAVSPPPQIRVYLRRAVEPDDEHRIVVMWDDGGLTAHAVERVWDDQTAWGSSHDRPGEVAAAFGVAYRGRRYGAAFVGLRDIVTLAVKSDDRELRKTIASALRWFRAPLLAPDLEEVVTLLVREDPIRAFWQWVVDDRGPLAGLRQEAPGSAWLTAVRHFLIEQRSDARLLRQLWGLLLKRERDEDRADAERRWLELLLEVSPAMTRQLILDGAASSGWTAALARRSEELLEEVAAVVGSADTFLKVAVTRFITAQDKRQPLDATDRANLERLLSVTAFRDYMLSRLVG